MGSGTRAEDQPLQRRSVAPFNNSLLFSGTVHLLMLDCFFFFNYPGVCSLNNKLYVVGGSDPCGQKGLKNCDVFDPVTKTWSNCASLNISTRLHFQIELFPLEMGVGAALIVTFLPQGGIRQQCASWRASCMWLEEQSPGTA